MLGPSQSFSAKLQFRALGTSQGKKKKKKKKKKKTFFGVAETILHSVRTIMTTPSDCSLMVKKSLATGKQRRHKKTIPFLSRRCCCKLELLFHNIIRTTSEINIDKMARSDDLVVSIGTTVGSLQRRREFDSRCHQPFSGNLPFQICSVSAYSEKKFKMDWII